MKFLKHLHYAERVSIQNVLNTTRIMVNPDIPEAYAFKSGLDFSSYLSRATLHGFCVNYVMVFRILLLFVCFRLAVQGIETSGEVAAIGLRVRPSLEEEFLRMHTRKTVAQLSGLDDEGLYVVGGVVDGFVEGADWWYPACKCHRSVSPDSGSYYCNGCVGHVFQVIPRWICFSPVYCYICLVAFLSQNSTFCGFAISLQLMCRFKVEVKVSGDESDAIFVLFDNDISFLLSKSCAMLVASVKVLCSFNST
jgi:hypothetical protein